MYAIYGNIHHQYTPNVSIYTIHMDPVGWETHPENGLTKQGNIHHLRVL